jgi:hypothetical protein
LGGSTLVEIKALTEMEENTHVHFGLHLNQLGRIVSPRTFSSEAKSLAQSPKTNRFREVAKTLMNL